MLVRIQPPESMSESRAMRYARPLGWAALAGAPILLTALALVASQPDTPASVITSAAIGAWIAGTLAFSAQLLHARRGSICARFVGGLATLLVVGACGLLVYRGMTFRPVGLDSRERANLIEQGSVTDLRLIHPHLDFSFPAPHPELRPSPEVAAESRRAAGERWASAHRVWAWTGEDTELVVDLARAPSADSTALQRATHALEADLRRAAASVEEHRHADQLATTLESNLPGGGRVLTRLVLFEKNGRAYRITVTVVTREPSRWRRWLDELQTSG